MKNSSSGQLNSVRNALRILSSFSIDQPEIGVTEIANSLGIAKSSASRLASVLESEGYLRKSENRKYRLGLSCLTLTGIITTNDEIYNEAMPSLRKLVANVGETAHLAVLDGEVVTYLLKVECNHPVRILTHIGRKNPLHATSSGKIFMAFHSKGLLESAIRSGLKRYASNTITDPVELESHIEMVRKLGYAYTVNEYEEGVVSVSAPVYNHLGHVNAAVNIVGPIQRMEEIRIPYYGKKLTAIAGEISEKIGYSPRMLSNANTQ